MREPTEFHLPADSDEAIRIQRALAGNVRLDPLPRPPRLVAGADLAFLPGRDIGVAAVVVVDLRSGQTVDEVIITRPVPFPYRTGLLSFREIPAVLDCLIGLHHQPDIIICDGQGIAHPRRIGLASHLGVVLNRPTIGCAKRCLIGDYIEPGPEKGATTPLLHQGLEIGRVVRTRTAVKPVFVSPGHRVTIEDAVAVVLAVAGGYRVPEPVRRAHLAAEQEKRRLLSPWSRRDWRGH
ncbi:MAG: endonuclease V [Acidobacteria bacterium]|nr:endonuclease V [Acidobacteriota bacterium]